MAKVVRLRTPATADVRDQIDQLDALLKKWGAPFVISRLAKWYGRRQVKEIAAALCKEQAGRRKEYDDEAALLYMSELIRSERVSLSQAAQKAIEAHGVGGRDPRQRLYLAYKDRCRTHREVVADCEEADRRAKI
jgi:hypothetical protein